MESFKIYTFLPYDCWVQLSRVDINLIISRRYCKLAYQCQSHHKRSLFFMFSLNKRNFNAWHEILFCWCTQQFLSHYYVVTKSPCLPFIVLDLSKASIVYLPRSRARWRSRVSAFIHFYQKMSSFAIHHMLVGFELLHLFLSKSEHKFILGCSRSSFRA